MRTNFLKVILRFLPVIILAVFFIPAVTIINAESSPKEHKILMETVNPDSTLQYKLKRLGEKVNQFIVSSFKQQEKVPYLIKLTDRRLAELYYVIENSKGSYLETSSSRYVTYIGYLVEEVSKNKGVAPQIKKAIEVHPNVLTKLRNKYPSGTAEWRFVQQALESAQVLLTKV